jgi:hypothetical protein
MTFEQQLRDDLRRAGAAAPVQDISWDETLGRARRIRRIYVAMVGAAAAVLLGAAVAAGSSFLDSPQGLPPAHPSPTPAPPPEEGVSLDQVEPSVKAWTHAIDDGRARAAWNLMTDRAQAEVGSFARFEEMVSNELAEGLGAFARAEGVRYETSVVASSGEGAAGVVTIAGVVHQEGATRPNAVAVPFRVLAFAGDRALIDQGFDGRWGVDPVRPALDVEGGNAFARGGPLEADIRPASGTVGELPSVTFHVDGDALTLPADVTRTTDGAFEQVRASAELPRSVEPGPHLLTIVAVDAGGRIYAHALHFELLPY